MGPKLEEQLCYSLYSTSRAVTQAYKSLLDPLNLTYPQYVVMMALWEKQSVTITHIAETTGLSNATLTPLLKRLEKNGFIKRKSIQNDERQKVIELTSKGKTLAIKADKAATQALCATGLNQTDVKKIMSLCDLIKTNLNNHN